jgi:hypothetical protein
MSNCRTEKVRINITYKGNKYKYVWCVGNTCTNNVIVRPICYFFLIILSAEVLHNEKLHILYSPNIIRQIKSRRMRWAGLAARMGEGRKVYKVLAGNPKEGDHSEDQGVDGRMGSEWILGRLDGEGVWSGFSWLRIGAGSGLL